MLQKSSRWSLYISSKKLFYNLKYIYMYLITLGFVHNWRKWASGGGVGGGVDKNWLLLIKGVGGKHIADFCWSRCGKEGWGSWGLSQPYFGWPHIQTATMYLLETSFIFQTAKNQFQKLFFIPYFVKLSR